MRAAGDAFDNAMAGCFFASLEFELLQRRYFKAEVKARSVLFNCVEGWYDSRARLSALGYMLPVNFEVGYRHIKKMVSHRWRLRGSRQISGL